MNSRNTSNVSLKSAILEMFEESKPELSDAQQSKETFEVVTLTPSDLSLLDSLETGIEKAINDSTESNNLVGNDELSLSESAGTGGFAYESNVLKAIALAKMTGVITKGAGASAAAADADMRIDGKIYNIEVKLNKNAQMGGSSIRFGKDGIKLVKPMENDVEQLLINIISENASDLNTLIQFISKQTPANINKKVSSFPMSCTKNAWQRAQSKGLLINKKLRYSADFIAKHYAKKGIFYIQIGGSGLFYMAGNPANLPIPKLDGDIDIEIRSARSGSKMLSSGIEVVGGGIRIQARLKTKGKSPYTADDPKSLIEMMKARKSGTSGSKSQPSKASSKPAANPTSRPVKSGSRRS